jgi:hypothetical protein
MTDVKTAWAHELADFGGNLARLAWALENLPERCPNAIQFKRLCQQAQLLEPEVPRLPEPKADPARVKAELAKLGDVKARIEAQGEDGKEWARRLLGKHKAGYKLNVTVLRFAREALAA